jgi:hypothetical protein
MEKKIVVFIGLCVGCVILFASCASKPSPEPVPPPSVTSPSEVVTQPEPLPRLDTGAEAIARNIALFADVEKARQAAIDAGAETYCPDELAQLDSFFDELKIEAVQDPGSNEVFDRGTDLILAYRELESKAKVLSSSEATEAQAERTATIQSKARADGIQSVVTEKAAYNEAVALLAQGDRNLNAGNIDAARADYRSAHEAFDAVFARVSK